MTKNGSREHSQNHNLGTAQKCTSLWPTTGIKMAAPFSSIEINLPFEGWKKIESRLFPPTVAHP